MEENPFHYFNFKRCFLSRVFIKNKVPADERTLVVCVVAGGLSGRLLELVAEPITVVRHNLDPNAICEFPFHSLFPMFVALKK